MITNWYSTNIDPGYLSRRLRIAYAMWLWESVNCEDQLPRLEQLQARRLYSEISPFIAIAEGPRGGNLNTFIYASVGAKIEEVYGQKMTARQLDEVLTDTGRALAEESYAALLKERRPVHMGVKGSPVLSKEVEIIVMPLRHENSDMETAGLVYDYQDTAEPS